MKTLSNVFSQMKELRSDFVILVLLGETYRIFFGYSEQSLIICHCLVIAIDYNKYQHKKPTVELHAVLDA